MLQSSFMFNKEKKKESSTDVLASLHEIAEDESTQQSPV